MIDKLVIDVDGVLNTGHLLYSSHGKEFKVFGPHDKDGLKIIKKYQISVVFITADVTGWPITRARIITDWGYDEEQLKLVTEEDRMNWFESNCDFDKTAYIADGYNDAPILAKVRLGIAPAGARREARSAAIFVTESAAGSGAVLDACLYIESIVNGKT